MKRSSLVTALALLAAVVPLNSSYFTADSMLREGQNSRDLHALREACLSNIEVARRNPLCHRFLPPSFKETNDHTEPLGTCGEKDSRCDCVAGSPDAICTYKICGFEGGSYSHPGLIFLAAQIRNDLKAKADDLGELELSTSFVGYADGMKWIDDRLPKPQPVPAKLAACLRNAMDFHKLDPRQYSQDERRDVEVALLRGCALEDSFQGIVEDFALDWPPGLPSHRRIETLIDSSLRSAELTVAIANGCKEGANVD